jgi:methylglutaconyl-CoA hydratase
MAYQFLITRRDGPVEYLWLNRPEVRNAFNDRVIGELAGWADSMQAPGEVRVVVLAGAGRSFCAGADIEWMAETIGYSEEQNLGDATKAARMLTALDSLPVPLIGRVQGAALGGGAGLAAVCDVVVAEEDAVFGFSEVKLGILPAVISPFVLGKIGRSAARELFLTGARFSAARAREIGLVHSVVPASELDATVSTYVDEVLSAGPEAVAAAKALIRNVWSRSAEEARAITASALAARRVSREGQEGLRAFLDKRPPSWE